MIWLAEVAHKCEKCGHTFKGFVGSMDPCPECGYKNWIVRKDDQRGEADGVVGVESDTGASGYVCVGWGWVAAAGLGDG